MEIPELPDIEAEADCVSDPGVDPEEGENVDSGIELGTLEEL